MSGSETRSLDIPSSSNLAISGKTPVGNTFMPTVGTLANLFQQLLTGIRVGVTVAAPTGSVQFTTNLDLSSVNWNGSTYADQTVETLATILGVNQNDLTVALQNQETLIRFTAQPNPNSLAPPTKDPSAWIYLYANGLGLFSATKVISPVTIQGQQKIIRKFSNLAAFPAAKAWIEVTTANFLNTDAESV